MNPNQMDAVAVLSMANWVMAELVRVFHGVSTDEAQAVVDTLAERRIPLVWQGGAMKRVLDPELPLKDQLLLLIASSPLNVATTDLFEWSGCENKPKKPYCLRLLRSMHAERLVELSSDEKTVQILPPGSRCVEELAASRSCR
ncbi:MAG: hypothetical protein LAP39_22325 [Acidobacteriia bacterium]|nr:hypothetical protein [Terriglobia bacterium]